MKKTKQDDIDWDKVNHDITDIILQQKKDRIKEKKNSLKLLAKQKKEQNIITVPAHYIGDIFKCPGCNRKKKYCGYGLCKSCCELNEYHTNPRRHKVVIDARNKYEKQKRFHEKIGNMDNIEKICLEHGFSPDVAEAIAMDGIILEKKMKEKGIIW
jgi:hypothetical protein